MRTMRPERIGKDRLEALIEAGGWQVEDTPQAIAKTFAFDTFGETLEFLVEVSALAETFATVPAISIVDGRSVTLTFGNPPAGGPDGIREADVDFAEALGT